MALGAALFFNVKLPINFDSPYKALSIQEFWRRWHITLGRFLRENVYIPLGGNRAGEVRACINLVATFLICGIWHGAGWNFIFWGFLHGVAIVAQRLWKKVGVSLPVVVAWILTFGFVNCAWVFFRARTWQDALRVLRGMAGLNGIALPEGWSHVVGSIRLPYVQFIPWKRIMEGNRDACLWLPVVLAMCLFFGNSNQMAESFKARWTSLIVVIAGAYGVLHLFRMKEFLYFNF